MKFLKTGAGLLQLACMYLTCPIAGHLAIRPVLLAMYKAP